VGFLVDLVAFLKLALKKIKKQVFLWLGSITPTLKTIMDD